MSLVAHGHKFTRIKGFDETTEHLFRNKVIRTKLSNSYELTRFMLGIILVCVGNIKTYFGKRIQNWPAINICRVSPEAA